MIITNQSIYKKEIKLQKTISQEKKKEVGFFHININFPIMTKNIKS